MGLGVEGVELRKRGPDGVTTILRIRGYSVCPSYLGGDAVNGKIEGGRYSGPGIAIGPATYDLRRTISS
jgi:hypothetical protein